MEEIVYLNGSLIPLSQAKISPFDWGFLYGYGVFETMRAYSGYIFLLEKHLSRLSSSANLLGIDIKNNADLEKAVYDTLQANHLTDARLRLTLSGGEGQPVPDPLVHKSPPTLFITARSYTPYPSQVYEHGFKAIVAQIRRNTRSPVSAMKSLNYMDNLLAQRAARLVGADQAILLNDQGYLAEGSTSNIFSITGDILFSPDEDSGILPGITREAVLQMAATLGIEVREKKITLEELLQAEEAFLTNSIMEIMPLTQISGQNIGIGKPGTLTQRLMTAYKELVESQIN